MNARCILPCRRVNLLEEALLEHVELVHFLHQEVRQLECLLQVGLALLRLSSLMNAALAQISSCHLAVHRHTRIGREFSEPGALAHALWSGVDFQLFFALETCSDNFAVFSYLASAVPAI